MFSSFRWSVPVRLSTSKRLRYPGERGPYSRYHICSNVQPAESIINLLLPQCDYDCFRCTRRQIGGARQSNFGRSKGERGSLRGTQIRRGASFHITCSTSVGTKWSSLCEAIFGLRKHQFWGKIPKTGFRSFPTVTHWRRPQKSSTWIDVFWKTGWRLQVASSVASSARRALQ